MCSKQAQNAFQYYKLLLLKIYTKQVIQDFLHTFVLSTVRLFCQKSHTIKATRYVDIFGVVMKRVDTNPSSMATLLSSGMLERAV